MWNVPNNSFPPDDGAPAADGPEAGPDPADGGPTADGPASASPFLPDDLLRNERVPGYAWALLAVLVALGVLSLWLTAQEAGGLWALTIYSIPSNTAISLLPHEPMLLMYGGRSNLWLGAAAATAGTVIAAWFDHRIFVPLLNVERIVGYKEAPLYRRVMDLFVRAPFAALVVAGVSPVPFFPFKLLAFSGGYALPRYLGAVAVGRFPRYLLLLWLGATFRIPAWLLLVAALLAFSAYGVHLVVRLLNRRRGDDGA